MFQNKGNNDDTVNLRFATFLKIKNFFVTKQEFLNFCRINIIV